MPLFFLKLPPPARPGTTCILTKNSHISFPYIPRRPTLFFFRPSRANTSRVTNCCFKPPHLVLRAKGCNAILGRPDIALVGFASTSNRISGYEVSKHIPRSSNFPPSMIVLAIWNYHVTSYYYNIFQLFFAENNSTKTTPIVNPVQSPSQDPLTRSLWHPNAPRLPAGCGLSIREMDEFLEYPKVTHLHYHHDLSNDLAIHWKWWKIHPESTSYEHLMSCQIQLTEFVLFYNSKKLDTG